MASETSIGPWVPGLWDCLACFRYIAIEMFSFGASKMRIAAIDLFYFMSAAVKFFESMTEYFAERIELSMPPSFSLKILAMAYSSVSSSSESNVSSS